MHKSSVARQVAHLEKNGYVRKEKDEKDQRRRLLYPTEKAEALFPLVQNYADEWNATLTEGLGKEEQEALLAMLQHLADQAVQHLHDDHPDDLLDFEDKKNEEGDK